MFLNNILEQAVKNVKESLLSARYKNKKNIIDHQERNESINSQLQRLGVFDIEYLAQLAQQERKKRSNLTNPHFLLNQEKSMLLFPKIENNPMSTTITHAHSNIMSQDSL